MQCFIQLMADYSWLEPFGQTNCIGEPMAASVKEDNYKLITKPINIVVEQYT